MEENISHADSLPGKSTVAPGISFKCYDIRNGEAPYGLNSDVNHLMFLLNGDLSVHCNAFPAIQVKGGELFLLPKSAVFALKALAPVSLLVCSFDSLNPIYNKLNIRIYTSLLPSIAYSFAPLPIQDMLGGYLSVLSEYIKRGIDSESMCKIKFHELFLLFERLYNKKEVACLFYPILGQSPDFKNRVMQYFPHVNNMDELARKVGMGRASFDTKFKKEFGMSPLQWILKEKAKHVYFSLSEPENTLSDIMNKYNFNSSTHLNRFCRQQFGCSPSELRKRLTTID
ncbi:MAG: helix-turn-helix transcriptional regulator [Tannerellaceae bacterium]|jgi:AraC-like DNA-binding protein|nr:helix-turn-helix transcriptional regulator [Tannerellaceae bacterium]